MFTAWRDRNKVSAIFVFLVIVSLLLFAVYLKAKPEIVKAPSDRMSSNVKFWADPNQSLDPKPRIVLFWSVIVLFTALLITPDTGSLLGLVFIRDAAPLNLFFGSRRWSRPPPAL